jgi:hypothetical protein
MTPPDPIIVPIWDRGRALFPMSRREQQEACRRSRAGSGSGVSVKARLGWRLLAPSRILPFGNLRPRGGEGM